MSEGKPIQLNNIGDLVAHLKGFAKTHEISYEGACLTQNMWDNIVQSKLMREAEQREIEAQRQFAMAQRNKLSIDHQLRKK